MRCPAIEPNVQHVRLFAKFGLARFWMRISGGKNILDRRLEPSPGATCLNQFRDALKYVLVENRLAGRNTEKDRYANPPCSLARNTPIRPVLDHSGDASLSLLRHPLHAADLLQGVAAKVVVIHINKPLLSRAINDRLFVALTVRVAM